MTVEIFALCDFAQDIVGKLNIIGAFDTISVKDFPTICNMLCITLRTRFEIYELGTHNVHIDITNNMGALLVPPMDGSITLNSIGNDSACTNLTLTMNNIKLDHEDTYKITLTIDKKEILSIPLYVKKMQKRK